MKRCQIFAPEDLSLMTKVYLRAGRERPNMMKSEMGKTSLAKAIVITYRQRISEAALAAAALHLASLKILD